MKNEVLEVVRAELGGVLRLVMALRLTNDTTTTMTQWSTLNPWQRDEIDRATRRRNEQLAHLYEQQALLERILHAQEQILLDYFEQEKEHVA